MIQPLYDWCLRMAGKRRALPILGGLTFLESIVFPIPTEVMAIPMVLAQRNKAWLIAAVMTVTSILGGVFGYLIGYGLYETVGKQIVALYGYADSMQEFAASYEEYGALIVVIGAFTPLPFKVVTVASGVAGMNIFTFILAGLAARGARYFLVCGLLWQFGPPIRTFVEARLNLVALVGGIVLVGGFVALKFI